MPIHDPPQAGKPYRPANGTEGMLFNTAFCDRCKHGEADPTTGDGCDIQLDTMLYCIDDERYPAEWKFDDDGRPTCTAFEEK